MKRFLIALLLLANSASAWETSNCHGTKKERLSALKILGDHAKIYKEQHGHLPDLMNEENPEFRKKIPKELNSYLISNWDEASIGYMCKLPSTTQNTPKVEECYFNIETKKINCEGLGFAPPPNL